MPYRIKVDYTTGDSGGTWPVTDYYVHPSYNEPLYGKDVAWGNIEVAKENLKRIKAHYLWVESYESYEYRYGKAGALPIPDFVSSHFDLVLDSYGNRKYIKNGGRCIYLLMDDGSESRFDTNWIGYFEHLNGAFIVAEEEDGWSFSL